MRLIKSILKLLASGALGAVLVLLVVGVLYLERRPDLKVWHEPLLTEEFTTESQVASFADYLALEDRLFAQLQSRGLRRRSIPRRPYTKINRYNRGSLADPEIWPVNWNRSYELAAEAPKAAVLLLHGMSDCPLQPAPHGAQSLQRKPAPGSWACAYRATAPRPPACSTCAGRTWRARVELAAEHLRAQAGEVPLYIVGYSIGGALAVDYALAVPGARPSCPSRRRPGAGLAGDRGHGPGRALGLAGASGPPPGPREARLERRFSWSTIPSSTAPSRSTRRPRFTC